MKKLILIPTILFQLFSCQQQLKSKDDIAKELIHTYLNKNLDDPKSYESIDFGALQKKYEPYSESLIKMNNAISEAEAIANLMQAEAYEDKSGKRKYDSTITALTNKNIKDSIEWTKNIPWCYEVGHSYRTKNKAGALEKFTKTFSIDTTITEVLGSQKLKY